MSTLSELRTRVNAWLAARWPTAVSRQETYFGSHGHYWQGLITHSQVPLHTTAADADSSPDRFTSRPTDQLSRWIDAFPEWDGVSAPAALVIDVYDGPLGHGWQATCLIYHDGTLYARTEAVGPEKALRDQAWHVVVAPG